MTNTQSTFPVVIAFRAGSDGTSYSLLRYERCMHLAVHRHGRLQQFINLGRKNLRTAFGEAEGDRIWLHLLTLKKARRR